MTALSWTPPPPTPGGGQTAALRAHGLTVDALKEAGFRWRFQAWHADDPPTGAQAAILAKLTGAAPVGIPALALAPAQSVTLPVPGTTSRDLERAGKAAQRLAAVAEAMRQAGEAAPGNTDKRRAHKERTLDDAARHARAGRLLQAWIDDPARADLGAADAKAAALEAAREEPRHVSNGYHGYAVGSGTPAPTTDAAALTLRRYLSTAATPADPAADARRDLAAHPHEGYWPTPPDIAAEMVARAGTITNQTRMLEPSAGTGAIVQAIKAACSTTCDLVVCESDPRCRAILETDPWLPNRAAPDFVAYAEGKPLPFDAIIMNPPYERRQWAEHVHYAIGLLKPGGRLVALIPATPDPTIDAMLASGFGTSDPREVTFHNGRRDTTLNVRIVTITNTWDA